MCQDNGCNPNFTNPDGSTFTAQCKWIDDVVQAPIPCYWEAVIPRGREICGETEAASEPERDSPGDAPQGQEAWVGRWTCKGRVGPPLNSTMNANFEIITDSGRLFATGVDEDIGKGRYLAELTGNRIRFVTPTVVKDGARWDLTRKGATSTGTINFVSPLGRTTGQINCKRK